MKSHHFSKEEFGNILSIIHFVAWNKMCHFAKTIHKHKDGVKTIHCAIVVLRLCNNVTNCPLSKPNFTRDKTLVRGGSLQ